MNVPQFTVIRALGQFDQYDSAEKVPSEFRLLVAGENDTLIGKLLFDGEAARSVMDTWRSRGIELMADYEHMSLAEPPVVAPAAARKWVPQVRNGEFWATEISWTDKAREMIAAGEYRYFSIACKLDKDRRVVQVINFALTNNPAANGIEPLVAASLPQAERESDMKTVIVALGLRADASESDALAAATRLRDLEREVLALTGKGELSEALGAMRALSQAQVQLQALNARMAQLETEKRGAEFDKVIADGVTDGKLTPAMLDASKSEFGKWIAQLRAKEDGVIQLRAAVSALPVQIPAKETTEAKDARAVDGEITFGKDEVEMADRFGIDLEKIAARRLKGNSSPVTKHKNGTVTIRGVK